MPIVCQAEAVIACAPVISWDVDALVDAASVVFSCTLVNICREDAKETIEIRMHMIHVVNTTFLSVECKAAAS